MNLPIRARLTLWYVAVLVVVLVGFSGGVLWLQHRFSRSQFDDELTTLATTMASAVRTELAQKPDLARAATKTREDFDIPNRTVAVLDVKGRPLAAHWRGFKRTSAPHITKQPSTVVTLLQDGLPWRVRWQREESPEGPFVILVAASENPLVREQHLLAKSLIVGTPTALAFAAFVCWWAASRALTPVTEMSDQAERITVQSLDARLSGDDADDEVGHLRRSFNHLLDRVAAGVATQRHFMADASHELRTPVSAARTAADVTLSQPHRDEDEYRDALGIVLAQTTRLGRMVDDMLVLARADIGGYRLRLGPCALADALTECADAAGVLAAAKGITFQTQLQSDVAITGDAGLVRQLTLNLLENAIKHTPSGGRVLLTLRREGDHAVIVVDDSGEGIPLSKRESIFERFVRLDEARDTSGGAGLGLPIARWIAEVHRGTLSLVSSGPQGSQFVARLPL